MSTAGDALGAELHAAALTGQLAYLHTAVAAAHDDAALLLLRLHLAPWTVPAGPDPRRLAGRIPLPRRPEDP